ncbi:NAD(P)-dependent oxidoreductase [Kitasatospora sp. MBT63]|uniref:NAD-dependent epimerase/dehydratase family protein n=1 Tax=Kitasatospora sp. MBT63 TaxID=1444768 RepID=UPI0007C6D890|nr:NAD-dependent epimerase/dehydratase family protein [Kitasatospora sp. MBT63]
MTPAHGTAPRILITGAGGFIGRHVAAAARTVPGARLTQMQHQSSLSTAHSGAAHVRADLTDPATLDGICDGIDIVLHCAARIAGPAEAVEAVNEHGTRALVEAAQRHGVRRLVQVSTASVYGRGTFRDAGPESLAVAPGSPASRSRAAAERIVLDAGGTVLRPHLVFGTGDRWVVPGLARLHGRLAASVDGWRARMSVVDVSDLARVAVAAATAPAGLPGAWHANHPVPVTGAELFDALVRTVGLPPAAEDIPAAEARRRLAEEPVLLHHLAMLSTDHWFASDRLWRESGCPEGTGLADSLARHAPWYREQLGLTRADGHPSTTSQ